MAAQTQQRFDFDHLKRSMESWDVDALLELYADDFEQDDMAAIFRHCHEVGVKIGLDNPVVGDERLACTITCYFDNGRRVVANSIMDLRDGRIVRQFDVQARDA